MAFLLDINALSEIDKPHPDKTFLQWFGQIDELELYLSCLSIGELYKGIELQADESKKRKLVARTEEIMAVFGERILNIDQSTTRLWGKLMGRGQQKGTMPVAIDALIAAHCLQYQMTLVTRNNKDFKRFSGLQIFCPWSDN